VETFLMEISAFGTTDPVGSLMVPDSVTPPFCACDGSERRKETVRTPAARALAVSFGII
jgi:hypothetical protein